MKVSIRDISLQTGFSPATVSNALNHKRGVNQETAEIILRKAREMGYTETERIRKVKFVILKNNGIIVEDTPFFPQMIAGVEQECRSLGMEMTIFHLDKRSDDAEVQRKQLLSDKTAAVILLGTELSSSEVSFIQQFQVPVVVIDYWSDRMLFDAVLINNEDSARMATEYLIGMGHREIGYLAGSYRIMPFVSRCKGYKAAMKQAGLPVEEKYHIELTPTMDGAFKEMKSYLETRPQLPTAFFADNDMVALGAMKALWERGIRVPDDISVVGFDDLSFSSISNPPLTTVRVPKELIGRSAVRRLRDLINSADEEPLKTEVCTRFIERDSVRRLETA